MAETKLSLQQERFVQGLIAGKTQTQAYMDAYPGVKSARTAASAASKLMKRADVAKKHDELRGRLLAGEEERALASGRAVLRELAKVAFANGTDYARVKRDGEGGLVLELLPTEEIPDDKKAAIAGYEKTSTGLKVRTHDKVRALEMLGKSLGVFSGEAVLPAGNEELRVEIKVVE